MSEVLTVPTHFNDIGELSEGFVDRVEQDTLILYGAVAYEDGAEIEFAVLLADGTTAFEGTGRVRAAVDGGEDRMPETRYDVVLEALSFDGRSEVVFERLVIDREGVSDHPAADEEATVTGEVDATPDAFEADEEFEMTVESLSPDVYDDDIDEDGPPTVMKEVDQDILAAASESDSSDVDVDDDEPADTVVAEVQVAQDEMIETEIAEDEVTEDEVAEADESELADEMPVEHEAEIAAVLANASATEISIEGDADGASTSDSERGAQFDSMYAFEHGIAAEPKVGMPVPMPSMAAPPMAPPAPPRLRLAEPPDGLTRPSMPEPEDTVFSVDGEVSDVHQTGMFAYEDALPIPERPPLPDPNRAKQVPPIEAANDYDVQDSESAELISDGFEEVRLSDFAEAVEEG
jgi:hypothetical protein